MRRTRGLDAALAACLATAATAGEPITLSAMGRFHVGGRFAGSTGQPVREVVFNPGRRASAETWNADETKRRVLAGNPFPHATEPSINLMRSCARSYRAGPRPPPRSPPPLSR